MSEATNKEIAYIQHCQKEAADALKDRRASWQELWDLYQGRQNNKAKKTWQSRVFVPKVLMTVEQASAIVKRAIVNLRRLFKIIPKQPDPQVRQLRNPIEERFRQYVRESNFSAAYEEMIKSAFLLGLGVVKVYWNDGGLQFENVDVATLYVDPFYHPGRDWRPQYIIETKERDLSEFKRRAKQINKSAGRGLYMNLDDLTAGAVQREDRDGFEQRRGFSGFTPTDRKVRLVEYWGDIIDDQGDEKPMKPNRLRVVANDRVMVRSQKNPFWHNMPPYVITTPIPYPHRGVAGISLVEPIVGMQYGYNNIFNMMLDNLNFTVNKAFEVDVGTVYDPHTLTEIYPGKMIKKEGDGRAVQEIPTSMVGQDAFAMLQVLGVEIEKGTAVTEFLMGTQGKTKTATEAELKTAQAQGLFDVIARNIEEHSLKPLMNMAFSLCAQYGDLPEWAPNAYRFEVGGLSLLLAQREQIAHIQEVLAMSLKIPEIGQLTNTAELYRRLLDIYNLADVYDESVTQGPTTEQAGQLRQRGEDKGKQIANQIIPRLQSPEQADAIIQQLGAM